MRVKLAMYLLISSNSIRLVSQKISLLVQDKFDESFLLNFTPYFTFLTTYSWNILSNILFMNSMTFLFIFYLLRQNVNLIYGLHPSINNTQKKLIFIQRLIVKTTSINNTKKYFKCLNKKIMVFERNRNRI